MRQVKCPSKKKGIRCGYLVLLHEGIDPMYEVGECKMCGLKVIIKRSDNGEKEGAV